MNNATDERRDGSPLLEASGIEKHFPVDTGFVNRLLGEDKYVHAVDGVSLSVDEQETVGLVGESGCGKTTLGRTLARLYQPTEGRIQFRGRDITGLSGSELRKIRKHVQVIFQDPLSSLNPRKTVGEIVSKPLDVHDLATGEEKNARVAELFEEVGLSPEYRSRYPHEFSGGQRQRIGIARALAVQPELIIADEPVSALDVSVQAQIINLLKRLQQEYGLSYVFIAHDLSVVKHVSDRVAVMYLGKIVEKGPTRAIFERPQHPYTRSLLAAIPNVDKAGSRRKSLLTGNPPSPIDPPSGCPFHPRCPEYIDEECEKREPELQPVSESDGRLHDGADDARPRDWDDAEHTAACHWSNHSTSERRENDPFRTETEK